ncbi:MAG TPA: hypothetical protein VKT31_14000 [Solirubrobacteraceae bacterium]|nr:hypothetical protein [Solirubrobacteraceae bacterium]
MSTAVAKQERLGHEARMRPRYAIVAAVAGVLLIATTIIHAVGPQPKVNEATVQLIVESKRTGLDLFGAALTALDSLAIAATLIFLLDAVRARNPNLPGFVRPVAIAGGVLTAVSTLADAILIAQKAHQFVTSGDQSYTQAHHLIGSGVVVILQLLGFLGAFVLALAVLLTALQAMRVGLLTRFTGYLGMISGAVVIVPTLIVAEAYWLLALAVLFAGRWPAGEPPAWSTGEAVPWPSAQEAREARIRASGGTGAGRGGRAGGKAGRGAAPKPSPKPSAKPATSGGGAVATAGAPAPRTGPKRKRKRRH